jgi:hypothetical protein
MTNELNDFPRRAPDQDRAPIEPFELESLDDVVTSFGGSSIYGWEFFDSPDKCWSHWKDRLSLDVNFEGGSDLHVVDLFQESATGNDRHLDVRIWFKVLAAYDYELNPIPLQEVAAGGRRWWDAMYSGDPRAESHGSIRLNQKLNSSFREARDLVAVGQSSLRGSTCQSEIVQVGSPTRIRAHY